MVDSVGRAVARLLRSQDEQRHLGEPGGNAMTRNVHLVGSVGLDSVEDVFSTVGRLLGPFLKRVPDGEPGGRRMWISWQSPLLRANPFLQVDAASPQLSDFPP